MTKNKEFKALAQRGYITAQEGMTQKTQLKIYLWLRKIKLSQK